MSLADPYVSAKRAPWFGLGIVSARHAEFVSPYRAPTRRVLSSYGNLTFGAVPTPEGTTRLILGNCSPGVPAWLW
jgi:hypothetical protein